MHLFRPKVLLHPRSRTVITPVRAFSLIEVLIALAVFSMAATYLMATFVNALEARQRGLAPAHLEEDVQSVRLQLLLEPKREDAEEGRSYETLHQGEARWRTNIEATNVVDLFKVQLEIEFSEPIHEDAKVYTEELYLLRPTWSESDERTELLADKKEALLDSRDFGGF